MSTDHDDFTSANLRVALLGPPQVTVPDGILALRRRQTRALLYYLAATPSPVPRGRLCLLFWPDISESEARRNLTHLLTLLRRSLPAALVVAGPDDVTLDTTLVWSDVRAFASSTSISDPVLRRGGLRKAVELWRGPFLDGFDSAGSDVFEAWTAQQRAWWEQRYLDALTSLIDAETARAAYPAAITLAQRYLAVDDLAEEIHRRLMRLYVASGDRTATLRQFERCREILAREVGVPPLLETQALFDDLVAGRSPVENHQQLPGPLPAQSHALPASVNSLIGRDDTVAETVRALLRTEVRLLTLTGAGGIGKTRLALAAAAAAESAFADGAVFVALAPIREPSLVPAAIAQTLGVREAPEQPILQVLGQALHARHLLLVLDNVEHVLRASSFITDLLAAAPHLTILTTS